MSTTIPIQPTDSSHNRTMSSLTLATLRNLLKNAIYYLFAYFVVMAAVYSIYFAVTETLFNLWYMPHLYKCALATKAMVCWWYGRQGMLD